GRVARGQRRQALRRERVQHLPRRAGRGARALARGTLRQAGPPRQRPDDRGRRGLHPRGDRESPGEARRGLPADHADLPGPDHRGRPSAARRLRQIALARAGGRRGGVGASAGTDPGKEDLAAMSTLAQTIPESRRPNYLNAAYGVRSWLLTIDHKRIAILYLIGVTFFFALGGLAAALIRLELLTPAGDVFQAETYNKIFTTHGVMMVFFFMIPGIPGVLGNFLIPLMIGAKDVAFPRLNLLSWYLFVIGGVTALWAVVHGGVEAGWTFYQPYSKRSP